MVAKIRWTLTAALLVLASSGVPSSAGSIDKALMEADGRRKAAESGLREIKTKFQERAEQVRPLYAEAASRNNAWLEIVCQAIQAGSATAPDVSATTESAAAALVQWVSARNRALGLPELTPPIAEAIKNRVSVELTDIANVTWKNNRGADEQNRVKAATALKDRLQWRTWDEVQ